MNNNAQGAARGSRSENPAFGGIPLAPRNRKELALFFRIRKMTVVTALVGSAMIIAAVCASLCMFAFSIHYTIATNSLGVLQFCALLVFGILAACAFIFTTKMISEAFISARVLHAALNPPSLKTSLGSTQVFVSAVAKQQDATIEHDTRAPGVVSTQQTGQPYSTEPVANDVHQTDTAAMQCTSAPMIESNHQSTDGPNANTSVNNSLTGLAVSASAGPLSYVGTQAVAHS